MAKIVVGYDGSEGSANALEWAAREAALRGAELELICSWRLPLAAGPFTPDVLDDQQSVMEEIGTEAADRIAKEHDLTGVTCHFTGAPARAALVDASRSADLLVVGSHGYGTVAGLLLGSVSLHGATHAECPVVVVRPHRPAEHQEGTT